MSSASGFSAVADAPIPLTARGTSTVHLHEGRAPGDFHLTFEREGDGGYYAYFNGVQWTAPVKVTEGPTYRGGVNLAVDSRNQAHLAWGIELPADEYRVLYRSVNALAPGPIETVKDGADHPECAIAVDATDRIVVAGTTDAKIGMGLHSRESAGVWRSSLAPTPTARGCWAPAVACADGGRVYLAYRNRENDSPTYWNVWREGQWTDYRFVPGHKFQPFVRADGAACLLTANAHAFAQFMRIEPDRDGNYTVSTAAIAPKLGRLRGAHVGLAQTAHGTLYASHASIEYPDTLTKTVRPGDFFALHTSRDSGRSWSPAQRVAADVAGQGFGNIAANGDVLMAVWPDVRGGELHLRYRLWCEAE